MPDFQMVAKASAASTPLYSVTLRGAGRFPALGLDRKEQETLAGELVAGRSWREDSGGAQLCEPVVENGGAEAYAPSREFAEGELLLAQLEGRAQDLGVLILRRVPVDIEKEVTVPLVDGLQWSPGGDVDETTAAHLNSLNGLAQVHR